MAGKSGLQMLLSAMGVNITPEQITGIIEHLSNTVVEVDKRLTRIEQKVDMLVNRMSGYQDARIPLSVQTLNSAGVAEASEELNGRAGG